MQHRRGSTEPGECVQQSPAVADAPELRRPIGARGEGFGAFLSMQRSASRLEHVLSGFVGGRCTAFLVPSHFIGLGIAVFVDSLHPRFEKIANRNAVQYQGLTKQCGAFAWKRSY